MSYPIFTCNGCTERYVGCHAQCDKYKQEYEANEKRKKDYKISREIDNYKMVGITERLNREAMEGMRKNAYGRYGHGKDI